MLTCRPCSHLIAGEAEVRESVRQSDGVTLACARTSQADAAAARRRRR
jgi:hypothetical protein